MTAASPNKCKGIPSLSDHAGVWLAGQPAPEHFALAMADGVKTVINQRHEAETPGFSEKKAAQDAGLVYHNVPFNGPAELTDALLDRTRDLLRTAPRPILLHCAGANRAAAVWSAYRVLDEGAELDTALADAKRAGLKTPDYERIVREYVARKRAAKR